MFELVANRRKTQCLNNCQVFYHIAAINNYWKNVVIEQKNILDNLGLEPICGVLGTDSDIDFVRELGLKIAYKSNNLNEYETPTLELLYQWSQCNDKSAVLYMHTKGVSADNDSKKLWRWLMTDLLIKEYDKNLHTLEVADMVGVNWQDSPQYPHFSGNFWMARTDWINVLSSPTDHKNCGGPNIVGNPWSRMHAEMWIGSKPYHIVESLFCRNQNYSNYNSLYNQYHNK